MWTKLPIGVEQVEVEEEVVVAAMAAAAMVGVAAATAVPEEVGAEVTETEAMVRDSIELREDSLLTLCRWWRREPAVRRKQ